MRWSVVAAVLVLLLTWVLRPQPVDVETVRAAAGPFETTVDAEGVTRALDRYTVAAPVSGRLERITLREGDAVEAGDVMARITPIPLDPQAAVQTRARLDGARAAVQELEARITQARAALEQAERTAQRVRTVAEAGGMSLESVERAELQHVAAEREHEALLARRRAAATEVEVIRAALAPLEPGRASVAPVRAPAAGRVLRVLEQSERAVAAGEPLAVIGGATGLEVVVEVLSTDAVRIRPGASMRLIDWGGDAALEARVRYVEPSGFTKVSALGVEEQRVNVIGDLQDPHAGLGDGYRVTARIVTWQTTHTLKLPASALFRTGQEWSIFVVEGGRARLRTVQLGHRGAGEVEVIGGIAEGDDVILFPSDRVRDGARVRLR